MSKSDRQLQQDIQEELTWDPKVNSALIGVSVDKGGISLKENFMLDAKVELLRLRKRFCNRPVVGLLAVGLAWLLIPASVHAADLRSGQRIMINRNTVIDDDLYISAETIEVDGVVHGDLFAVGEHDFDLPWHQKPAA